MTLRVAQVLLAFLLMSVGLAEKESEEGQVEQIHYQGLEVRKSIFGDFSMMRKERDDYATTLTLLALEDARADPGDVAKMNEVRGLIALALHLSPRNRTAVIANHQLERGLMPEKKEADYSRSVFARLLLTRGKLLKDQKTKSDQFVGRCFVQLAAELDLRNEEAVYGSEIQKIDGVEVDWSIFTDGVDADEE